MKFFSVEKLQKDLT